jgi:glucuronyl/N-acetylglucosaminyl transferase EXT1
MTLVKKAADINVGMIRPLQIIVVWSSEKAPPPRSRWPSIPATVPLNVLQPQSFFNSNVNTGEQQATQQSRSSISQRFYPHPLIQTAGVLSLDEDCLLTTDEVDFAFEVWKSFPDRIVGYPARSHFWDDAKVIARLLVLFFF